jgi:peptide/nickel transport system ATP-binding protein
VKCECDAAPSRGPTTFSLEVSDLRVESQLLASDIVSEVGFNLRHGETLGIVGESGSGKTTVALALLATARPGTMITSGQVKVSGVDILSLSEKEQRALRGSSISYVPQDPATALSPSMRVGEQIHEIVDAHPFAENDRETLVAQALEAAQLPSTIDFMRRYPHQLSGGQQQRVMIAMALVCRPTVIVMDEPTTGLDVTTQSKLLAEIRRLATVSGTAIVYVSHDLAVVRNLADSVVVMYGGRMVEGGIADGLFRRPFHPYTRRLLEAIPRLDGAPPRGLAGMAVEPWNRPPGCPFGPRCEFRADQCAEMPGRHAHETGWVRCWLADEVSADQGGRQFVEREAATARQCPAPGESPENRSVPLLEVVSVTAGYGPGWGRGLGATSVNAVDEVSVTVNAGSCLGIVGESGSGKTTLLRCIAGFHAPRAGEIQFDSSTLAADARRRSLQQRRGIQLIPQNPDSSLNPRHTIEELVGRPLRQFHGLTRGAQQAKVAEILERVRLRTTMMSRLPRELSGGEKQRVAIARALAAEPQLLLCDEITSALDVVVQAGLLDLLLNLRMELDMTMIFVSHDLGVVRAVSDTVTVMRDGRVVERQAAALLFAAPSEAYTRELISAIPQLRTSDFPSAETSVPLPSDRS